MCRYVHGDNSLRHLPYRQNDFGDPILLQHCLPRQLDLAVIEDLRMNEHVVSNKRSTFGHASDGACFYENAFKRISSDRLYSRSPPRFTEDSSDVAAHVNDFDIDRIPYFPGIGAQIAADVSLSDVAEAPDAWQKFHEQPKCAHA